MSNFYFYTETAFHHQGDLPYLKDLVHASHQAGATGVKFQVLTRPADFISKKHSAYEELASYCLNVEQWKKVFHYTESLGLDIIMMPLNSEALELRHHFDIKYLDLHSISFNDKRLHERIRETGISLILGVGGRTLEEIQSLKKDFDRQTEVLMAGFQSFPSKLEEVNLGRIKYLKEHFTDLEIGYADHSAFDHPHAVSSHEYAFLLGATFFEKHITLREGHERVDSSAAVTPDKIREIIERIDFLANHVLIPRNQAFSFHDKEWTYRNRQAACVANMPIEKDEVIKPEHVTLKLIDDTDHIFTDLQEVIGKVAACRIERDEPIKRHKLE